jgi:hypothetical protein
MTEDKKYYFPFFLNRIKVLINYFNFKISFI